MGQVFRADPRTAFKHPDGAIGYGPGGPFDCIGTWAKVTGCRVRGRVFPEGHRLTCYATGHADTFFSVPACTRYKGKHVRGYFTMDNDGPIFNAYHG